MERQINNLFWTLNNNFILGLKKLLCGQQGRGYKYSRLLITIDYYTYPHLILLLHNITNHVSTIRHFDLDNHYLVWDCMDVQSKTRHIATLDTDFKCLKSHIIILYWNIFDIFLTEPKNCKTQFTAYITFRWILSLDTYIIGCRGMIYYLDVPGPDFYIPHSSFWFNVHVLDVCRSKAL